MSRSPIPPDVTAHLIDALATMLVAELTHVVVDSAHDVEKTRSKDGNDQPQSRRRA